MERILCTRNSNVQFMYCKEAERIQEMKEGQCGSNSQRVGKGQVILASQAMLRTSI